MNNKTRLEKHHENLIKNEMKGSLLHFDDLDKDEQIIISRDFFSAHSEGRDPYIDFSNVLMSWGIMCIHSINSRKNVGAKCEYCHTYVIY